MLRKIVRYSPLPDCLTVKKSRLHGLGLFAKEKVPSACDLGISSVEDSRVPEGEIRTPLGGFINHSFKPNCDIVQKRGVYRLVTLREIKKDEELTVDYSPWYDKAMLKTYN